MLSKPTWLWGKTGAAVAEVELAAAAIVEHKKQCLDGVCLDLSEVEWWERWTDDGGQWTVDKDGESKRRDRYETGYRDGVRV